MNALIDYRGLIVLFMANKTGQKKGILHGTWTRTGRQQNHCYEELEGKRLLKSGTGLGILQAISTWRTHIHANLSHSFVIFCLRT